MNEMCRECLRSTRYAPASMCRDSHEIQVLLLMLQVFKAIKIMVVYRPCMTEHLHMFILQHLKAWVATDVWDSVETVWLSVGVTFGHKALLQCLHRLLASSLYLRQLESQATRKRQPQRGSRISSRVCARSQAFQTVCGGVTMYV